MSIPNSHIGGQAESYTGGRGGAASHPQADRPSSTIDSVISRLEGFTQNLIRMTGRLQQVADATMGSQPSAVPNTKIDHPPQTLQEYTSYLEDRIAALDTQIGRFF